MNRDQWKGFASGCRKAARDRLRAGCGSTFTFGFTVQGIAYTVAVERIKCASYHNTRRMTGTPIRVYTSRLNDRPRRSLQAECLAWAGKYRRNAAADRLSTVHPRGREISVSACLHEIRECRELGSAFNALPA